MSSRAEDFDLEGRSLPTPDINNNLDFKLMEF